MVVKLYKTNTDIINKIRGSLIVWHIQNPTSLCSLMVSKYWSLTLSYIAVFETLKSLLWSENSSVITGLCVYVCVCARARVQLVNITVLMFF